MPVLAYTWTSVDAELILDHTPARARSFGLTRTEEYSEDHTYVVKNGEFYEQTTKRKNNVLM
jgi:hypothetical protein